MSDTFTLPDMRSLIIRNLQGCNQYPNMPDLRRLEKQAQIKEIDTPKTDRILSVYDRAIFTLPYADTVIISGHTARPDGYVLHGQIQPYNHIHNYLIALHGQVFKKSKLHPIIEMEEHFLVYYSYATKYHKLASMNIPGYQCSNEYINVEKGALMNKDIQ
ncbi:MAG: hypothetical protein PHG64_15055 [Paludibacter sp.]|nr:hypothetical protein [Paludibacter sp.]